MVQQKKTCYSPLKAIQTQEDTITLLGEFFMQILVPKREHIVYTILDEVSVCSFIGLVVSRNVGCMFESYDNVFKSHL